MDTAKKQTEDLINKVKNMQEFIVERDWDLIPNGVVKYDVKHKQGQLAKIYVHALSKDEAENLVDNWLNEY